MGWGNKTSTPVPLRPFSNLLHGRSRVTLSPHFVPISRVFGSKSFPAAISHFQEGAKECSEIFEIIFFLSSPCFTACPSFSSPLSFFPSPFFLLSPLLLTVQPQNGKSPINSSSSHVAASCNKGKEGRRRKERGRRGSGGQMPRDEDEDAAGRKGKTSGNISTPPTVQLPDY